MRKYYTLVVDFMPDSKQEELGDYLSRQGIIYTVGADLNEELARFGYKPINKSPDLKKIYRVLIEEHELSAIMLSVDGVQVIQNRKSVNIQNSVRTMFSWFLK